MTLTEEKVAEYKEMFSLFASDSDGTIDRNEFDIVTNFFGIMLSATEQSDIFSELEEEAEMNCTEFLAVMDVISELGGGGGKVNLKVLREKMESRRREARSRQQIRREAFGAPDTDGGGDGIVPEEELGGAVGSRLEEEGRGVPQGAIGDTIVLADVDDDEDYLLHAVV